MYSSKRPFRASQTCSIFTALLLFVVLISFSLFSTPVSTIVAKSSEENVKNTPIDVETTTEVSDAPEN